MTKRRGQRRHRDRAFVSTEIPDDFVRKKNTPFAVGAKRRW
jgi:hypothetical protein